MEIRSEENALNLKIGERMIGYPIKIAKVERYAHGWTVDAVDEFGTALRAFTLNGAVSALRKGRKVKVSFSFGGAVREGANGEFVIRAEGPTFRRMNGKRLPEDHLK